MQEASAPPRGQPGTPQASLLAGLEASGVPVIERRYSPGEHPYMRGDPDEGLWFLLEGTLEIYKLYGVFSKATVRRLDGGGLFGEPSLRSEGRHRDSAEALSACRAAKVPKGPLLGRLSEDASHAPALLHSFAGCAEEREAATERLLDREVERRLALLLLELAGRFGEGDSRGRRVRMRLSHYELSCMVACTREAVSKVMGEFREAGPHRDAEVMRGGGAERVGPEEGGVVARGSARGRWDARNESPRRAQPPRAWVARARDLPRACPAAAARDRVGLAFGAHAPRGAHPMTPDSTRESRAGKE